MQERLRLVTFAFSEVRISQSICSLTRRDACTPSSFHESSAGWTVTLTTLTLGFDFVFCAEGGFMHRVLITPGPIQRGSCISNANGPMEHHALVFRCALTRSPLSLIFLLSNIASELIEIPIPSQWALTQLHSANLG